MRWSLLAALALGCSASPQYQDTCEPHEPALAVCCPTCSDYDIDLSARIWGAYEDCADPGAIQIESVVVPCNNVEFVGCAPMNGDWVQYREDGPHPDITIAHELGHTQGYDHDSSSCTLMNSGELLSYSCSTVTFGDCSYAVPRE